MREGFLDAKKVLAFAEEIVAEQTRPYPQWNTEDVIHAVFDGVVKWDTKLRSDFTTGMSYRGEDI